MKVIILAAGEGSRLRPYTLERPKCMVTLNNKPLIEYQLELFKKFGINDIIIVKGYLKDKLNYPDIKYYVNEDYSTTNMVRTLFCAEPELKDDIIITYGDIVYEPYVLENLIKSKDDISVIVDKGWRKLWELRFDNPLDDAETMKLENGYIKEIGQKPKDYSEIEGQYIGLMRFKGEGLKKIKNLYYQADKDDKEAQKVLEQDKPLDNAYMTDLIQSSINNNIPVKAVFIKNGWLEIDSAEEYELFNKKFNAGELTDYFKI